MSRLRVNNQQDKSDNTSNWKDQIPGLKDGSSDELTLLKIEIERITRLNQSLEAKNNCLRTTLSRVVNEASNSFYKIKALEHDEQSTLLNSHQNQTPEICPLAENNPSKEKAGWVEWGKAPLVEEEKDNGTNEGVTWEKCEGNEYSNFVTGNLKAEEEYRPKYQETELSQYGGFPRKDTGKRGRRKRKKKKKTKTKVDTEHGQNPDSLVQANEQATEDASDSLQGDLLNLRHQFLEVLDENDSLKANYKNAEEQINNLMEESRRLEESEVVCKRVIEKKNEQILEFHSTMNWLRKNWPDAFEDLQNNKTIPTKSLSPEKSMRPSTPAKPSAERAFLLLAEMLAHTVTCHEEGRFSLTEEELDAIREIRHGRNVLAHPRVEGKMTKENFATIKKTLRSSETLEEENKACWLNNEGKIESIFRKFLSMKAQTQ